MQKSQCFQGFSAKYEKRQQTMIGPHNPKVVGSNPSSATISVTVVDTISTTVIFYFLLFCRCFLREIRDFRNISDFEQTMPPHLPQYGVPQSVAWENCNRYKNTNDKLLFFILI